MIVICNWDGHHNSEVVYMVPGKSLQRETATKRQVMKQRHWIYKRSEGRRKLNKGGFQHPFGMDGRKELEILVSEDDLMSSTPGNRRIRSCVKERPLHLS